MYFHLLGETTLSCSKVFPKYLNVVFGLHSSRGTSMTRTGCVLKSGVSPGVHRNFAGGGFEGGKPEGGNANLILE
jgi:hypothetical protein